MCLGPKLWVGRRDERLWLDCDTGIYVSARSLDSPLPQPTFARSTNYFRYISLRHFAYYPPSNGNLDVVKTPTLFFFYGRVRLTARLLRANMMARGLTTTESLEFSCIMLLGWWLYGGCGWQLSSSLQVRHSILTGYAIRPRHRNALCVSIFGFCGGVAFFLIAAKIVDLVDTQGPHQVSQPTPLLLIPASTTTSRLIHCLFLNMSACKLILLYNRSLFFWRGSRFDCGVRCIWWTLGRCLQCLKYGGGINWWSSVKNKTLDIDIRMAL